MTEKIDNIAPTVSNFIRNIVEEDLKSGKHSQIITRFPPEPNGYLHVGHAKAVCHNFGLAKDYAGLCNLRFDDTNPEKENDEYVRSIQEDISWLGFDWNGEAKYASDYFDKLYEFAEWFINQGLAYVDDLTAEEMREYRGTLTSPGKNSPYRERTIAENLELFRRMKAGEFADGAKVLRLKIDMTSPNMNLRDPAIYRIKRFHHIRTGDKWCIYPMYDYTHCISDALESITHSCCSLEFEDHRPLYDWVVDKLYLAELLPARPRQIEFSRLELHYTVTSKRKLNQLVTEGLVSGWDDPRMPTISGMRRRGYTPAGIRLFATRCGISKSPNIVDLGFLETAIRDDLEGAVPRVMAVLNPLKVVLTNFASDKTGSREADFHPQHPEFGSRLCELSKEIYIDADDFQEIPEKGFQRLTIGGEVRLRHSYVIKCDELIKNPDGMIKELHCSIDHDTLGKNPEGRKVKGVIHWVSVEKSVPAEIRLYDRLFTVEEPDNVDGHDFKEFINPESLKTITAYIEPAIKTARNEDRFQFERVGYFVADRYDYSPDKPVFNKTVGLKDNWRK
ncbi:glutamine--tRNA ligase/YqeY domain fusion protein [Aquella oligotrophica]|uniref:Glutamine--tRNA ligase n=1 Tax=Aquella oligotrophica TaxID=2067065 RepID=A0A2I7N3B2_9NEIS|nr:glutamine--tRNA ligase/YqeY domain fusion protein [Aquella oligotrophica]AUR50947.1 glutamine--tRNA ligase [Aquella oligotrophica]